MTPYPAPPNTTEVTVPEDDYETEPEQKSDPSSHQAKRRVSPLVAGLLGAGIGLTGAGAGFALNSYLNRPTAPPNQSTTIIEGSNGGAVDVLVR